MKPFQVAASLWPWRAALIVGAVVWGGFILLSLTGGQIEAGSVITSLANALAVSTLVGGIGALGINVETSSSRTTSTATAAAANTSLVWAKRHPWRFAFAPALVLAVALLVIRLATLALNIVGPWRTVGDTLLDVSVWSKNRS